jgi:hypothetical protein
VPINIENTLFLLASEKYFKNVNMIIQVIASWKEMWINIELSFWVVIILKFVRRIRLDCKP